METLNYQVLDATGVEVGRYNQLSDAIDAWGANTGGLGTILTIPAWADLTDAIRAKTAEASPASEAPAPKFRLPKVDSATFKGILVFLYTNIPAAIVFFKEPEVVSFIVRFYPWLVPIVTLLPAVLALIVGLKRKDVANY